MGRVIFHIDLNAFYASCEELRHPEYKGKPLAIGSKDRRSVLSTANYEARKKGVHSAMPVYQALSLCPELILIEGDFNYYRALSARFFSCLKKYTFKIEPASIDECYMDVTEIIKQYKRPLDLAFQIQQSVLNETGLSVSIGVAPNRFLAKMASDMRKPAGITVLRISELETKLWPLDISLMYGIGKKTVPELKKIGIQTIGDFASAENETKILQLMKNSGYALIQKARGHSSSQLHYSYTQKSCSVSKTYSSNIYTLKEAFDKVKELSIELSNRLKKDNQKGKLISISLRELNFHTIVRSQSLNQYTNQPQIIYEIATNLIESNFESNGYRYMALTRASLQNANQIVDQISLFEIPIQDSKTIIEQLNHELKKDVLFRASDLLIKESK